MPRSIINQLGYTGGELAPSMDARVDMPQYKVGCRLLQNMIATKNGGATRRPGTIKIAPAKFANDGVWQYAARMMSFQYSPTTSFMLEFGHQYIRFYSNKSQVVLNTAPLWVAFTHYFPGDFVEDPGDGNNIYYCYEEVISPTQPHAELNKWVKQAIYEVPTPFNGRTPLGDSIFSVDVWRVVPCQLNDVVYLVHPSYPPYKLTRHADTDWSLEQVMFLTPAMLDVNASGVMLTSSSKTGATNLTAAAPAWVTATYYAVGRSVTQGGVLYTCVFAHVSGGFAADNTNGYWKVETIFTAQNIGGYFQTQHVRQAASQVQALTANGVSAGIEASGDCQLDTYGTWSATVDLERSDDLGVTWNKVQTVTSLADHNASIPIKVGTDVATFRLNVTNWTASTGTPRAVFSLVSTLALGLVQITAVAGPYAASGTVISKVYDITATPIWAEGAWSARRGYPQAITAFQQRMMYGGSTFEPSRLWGTVTNDLENFALGDQALATDGFAFDLAAVGRGRIQWLIGQVDLFVGFAAAEWSVNGGGGNSTRQNPPITATQINAGENSTWGSAEGVPPEIVGNSVLYTQRAGRSIMQMNFSIYTNRYQSIDLSSLSEHLFGAGIAQFAYQPQFRIQSLVWVTTKSGAACGMTYDQQQQVAAWHRHITGVNPADGSYDAFESAACIAGLNNDDDEVWLVVSRDSGKYIELMSPDNWETDGPPEKGVPQPNLRGAIYVDACVSYDSPVSATLTGLDHLVGRDVIGLLNGQAAIGPYTVQPDGSITVDNYVPAPGDIVRVGLPIYYAVQGMRMDQDERVGNILSVTKAIAKAFIRVLNSLGGKVKGDAVRDQAINYRSKNLPIDQYPPLFTGEKELLVSGTQTDDPVFLVQGSDPLPLTLLATTLRTGITGTA